MEMLALRGRMYTVLYMYVLYTSAHSEGIISISLHRAASISYLIKYSGEPLSIVYIDGSMLLGPT